MTTPSDQDLLLRWMATARELGLARRSYARPDEVKALVADYTEDLIGLTSRVLIKRHGRAVIAACLEPFTSLSL